MDRVKTEKTDLIRYLLKHNYQGYRPKLMAAAILLGLSVIGVVVDATDYLMIDDSVGYVSWLLFVITAVLLVKEVRDYKKNRDLDDPLLSFRQQKIKTREERGFLDGTKSVLFSELQPHPAESALGMSNYNPDDEVCAEAALTSINFNDRFCLVRHLPVQINQQENQFINSSSRIRSKQFEFLIAKVLNSEKRTFNGSKINLDTSFAEMCDLVDNQTAKDQCSTAIKLSKSGYFDGLVTAEAFRSSMQKYQYQTDYKKGHRVYLTKYFPFSRIDHQCCLSAQPIPNISQAIGITSVGITSDHKVVFFEQQKNQAIGAGRFVSAGSGSTDYKDIHVAEDSKNLLSIITYAMARELSEECYLFGKAKNNAPKDVHTVAQETHCTGYFKWIDRCGHPEFTGVTKINRRHHEIESDREEVYNCAEEYPALAAIQVTSFSGLTNFINTLELTCRQQDKKISLSFYMALKRLQEIGTYEQANCSIKKAVFNELNQFLFGSQFE